MRFLTERIVAAGGRLQQRRVTHASEVAGDVYDALVDCCGLGSANLFQDKELYPIRGQILRVKAPWINQIFLAEPFYVSGSR